MLIRSAIVSLFLVTALLVACSEDENLPTSSDGYVDGYTLLGLVDGRTFQYLQTDSVISFDPVFSIDVSTSEQTIVVAKTGDEWIIYDDSIPMINLRVTGQSVLQNGYWQRINNEDSLFYVAVPPVNMKRSLTSGSNWDGFTPALASGESSLMMSFYFAHHGFFFTKQLVGTENVVVPAGSFNTYRFSVDLFISPYDSVAVAHVDEYYAPNIGLVQQHFRGGALNRTLSLIDHYQGSTL